MKTFTKFTNTNVTSLFVVLALIVLNLPSFANAEVGGTITKSVNTETITVGPELKDCIGVGPMECMIVDGLFFYDTIEGFNYEEGYTYELEIIKSESSPEDVPADAGIYAYELVKIVSKTAQVTLPPKETIMQNILAQLDFIIGAYIKLGEWHHDDGTFTFTEDGFSTSAGCNTIGGGYERDGYNLVFGETMSTLMMCESADTMAAEAELIKKLSGIKSFSFDKTGISLIGDEGTIILRR